MARTCIGGAAYPNFTSAPPLTRSPSRSSRCLCSRVRPCFPRDAHVSLHSFLSPLPPPLPLPLPPKAILSTLVVPETKQKSLEELSGEGQNDFIKTASV